MHLQIYPDNNNLFPLKHHTETALIKIINDLLRASDSTLLPIHILLDLTAAFDTVSRQLLMIGLSA